MNDMEWLKRVMEKLRNMCEGRQPVAPGCEGVVSLAKEEDCWSTVKLSGEIVEGADVEVRKLVLYYKELPQAIFLQTASSPTSTGKGQSESYRLNCMSKSI